MLVTLMRTTIIYTTLMVLMRLMGKRQIGEMQPFEFTVTLIIADLACIPMADLTVPLLYGIIAMSGLFLLHQILSLLEQRGGIIKSVISGRPSLVIDKNGVNVKELRKNNMDVEDLVESMRWSGYSSFEQLDYAIFESNGKLSALENENSETPSSIPVLIIKRGKAVSCNLLKVKIADDVLRTFLKNANATVKDTEVMTVDGTGKVYLKEKNQRFRILSIPLPEGVTW